MNKSTLLMISLLSAATLLSGCASNLQGDTYSREDARQVQTVSYGTVEAAKLVVIEGTKTPIGGIAGAVIGGLAGSTIGGGTGSDIAAVAGAVAGGLAGGKAEEELTKSQGIELVIRMDESNKVISVVQADNPNQPINVGDRVRLMSVNGQTRVSK
jgi:outer membrane lipoprotein SlyB